jgi:4-hydroxy-tetrahydrodipicolinate synthase
MPQKEFSIRGVIPNLITPFDKDGEIDWNGVEREVKFLDDAGVDAICLGGCLSEISGSPAEELLQLCQAVRSATTKAVIAAIFPDSEPEAVELLDAITRGGASAAIIAQPHYLFQPGAKPLGDMFRRLGDISAIPILLGNLLSTAQLDLADVTELMEEDLIQGVVQGGGNAHLLVDLLRLQPRTPVFSGVEDLHYVGLILGADGIVSDLAALAPAECVAMRQDVINCNQEGARRRHEKLLRIWRVLEHPVEQLSRVRLALAAEGRDSGAPRSPYALTLDDSAVAQVRGVLRREGIAAV